jgi:hypothetical protein
MLASQSEGIMPSRISMRTLTLDLQDGFSGDEVIIRVNGREIERRSDVRTKRMLGLAESVEIALPDGPVTLELEVPGRRISGHTDVRHAKVGASLAGNGMQFIQSEEPFGYG